MAKGAKSFLEAFNKQAAQEEAREARRRREERRRGKFFTFKEDSTTQLRLLSPGSDLLISRGKMGKLIYKHFLYWDGKSQGIHTCPLQSFPNVYDRCEICEALESVSSVVDEETLRRQRARARAFFNVLIREVSDLDNNPVEKEMWGKVVVLDAPTDFYDWVHISMNQPKFGFFVDPYKGCDVIIVRTGTGFDTKYQYSLAPGEWTPVMGTEEETDKLYEKLPDLEAMVALKDEHLAKIRDAARSVLRWGSRFGRIDDSGVSGGSLEELAKTLGGGRSGQQQAPTPPQAPQEAPTPPQAPQEAPTPPQAPQEALAPVSPPDMNPNTKLPVCYGNWKKRNPGVEPGSDSADVQCRVCLYALACSYE